MSVKTGLDICGENGEYHTLVLDSPLYQKKLKITDYQTQSKDNLMYLEFLKINLEEKS